MCCNEKFKVLLNKRVQLELKLCESNGGFLNLRNHFINNFHMNLILQAILSNNEYLKIIKNMDFSSNCLDDDFLLNFLNVLEKFTNLKILNLSNNQFTIKSLIYFSTVVKKIDNSCKKLVSKLNNQIKKKVRT